MFQRLLPVLGVISLAACAANTVMVRIDDNSPETREVQKLDCGAYDQRGEALRMGVDFGLVFGVVRGGPFVEQARLAGINWDKSVHHMVVQYKEVCSRFNSGALSQTAYDTRIAEIDHFWAEAQGIRQSIDETIRGHGQKSFDELERSTPDQGAASMNDRQHIADQVAALVSKLGAR